MLKGLAGAGRLPATLGCSDSRPAPSRSQQAATTRRRVAAAQAQAGEAQGSGASTSSDGAAPKAEAQPAGASSLPPAVLRKAAAARDANEALEVLLEELGSGDGGVPALREADALAVMLAALDRDNAELAQSVYRAMKKAAPGGSVDLSGGGAAAAWPPASIDTSAALAAGLARALQTRAAIAIVDGVRGRGLPRGAAEDVGFGYLVACPYNPATPLAVVQPQEGVKPAADAISRYEYELYSGSVASGSSESLVSERGWLGGAAVALGLVRRPAAAAVHTLTVQTPGGQQRTFRVGTATADVPAKPGDRVTVVCSPQAPVFSRRPFLNSAPPGTKPGEALSLSNHSTGTTTQLLRPPPPGGTQGLPSWALPAAVVLAGSDAASGLIDPVLPYLLAGSAAAAIAAGVAGSTVVLPRLKQLPERQVEVAAVRQRLLAQHASLDGRLAELVGGATDDVRMLARLWQLAGKMRAVAPEGVYDARLGRVEAARAAIEHRLKKRIQLADSYARVLSMIEIEVEMETEVPAAEVLGIEQQIQRLEEVEELQQDWELQAAAADEVERLLRTAP